jgi:hypothetical protein
MKMRLIVVSCLLLFACSDENEFQYLSLSRERIEYNGGTKANFFATVANESSYPLQQTGFFISVYPDFRSGYTLTTETSHVGEYNAENIADLPRGRRMYMKALAATEKGQLLGRTLSFATDGEVNKGTWNSVVEENGTLYVNIYATFSVNESTYFLLGEKGLYRFNHNTNEVNLVMHHDVINNASMSCVVDGQVFIYSKDRFYKFDTSDNTFTPLALTPFGKVMFPAHFIIGNTIYLGLGRTIFNSGSFGYNALFWKFDTSKNEWSPIAPFPGENRELAMSFTQNNFGFVGGGSNRQEGLVSFNDLWQYDPGTNEWKQKASVPLDAPPHENLTGTANGNFGYALFFFDLYEYNTAYDYWEKMTKIPSITFAYPGSALFSREGKLYRANFSGSTTLSFTLWSYEK